MKTSQLNSSIKSYVTYRRARISKTIEEINTSDYITLMLKFALDHNAEILKVATIYAGSFNDIKTHRQKDLIKNIKGVTKEYSKRIDDLLKQALEEIELKESNKANLERVKG